MSWAARLAALSEPENACADSAKSANSPAEAPIGTNGTIGRGIFPPADRSEAAIEAAYAAEERAAIQAEGTDAPLVSMPHDLPPSWADPTIEPTTGARCRCCRGSTWWIEATTSRGWRCVSCHPPDHLPPDRRRIIRSNER